MRRVAYVAVVVGLVVCGGCRTRLPSGITHSVLPDGRHQYVFTEVYVEDNKPGWLQEAPKLMKELGDFAETDEILVSSNKREVVVRRTAEIGDLKGFCDQYANGVGIFPYWEEYVARDTRSTGVVYDMYESVHEGIVLCDTGPKMFGPPRVSKVLQTDSNVFLVTIEHPPWQGKGAGVITHFAVNHSNGIFDVESNPLPIPQEGLVPRDLNTFASPIRFDEDRTGTLRLNRATAFCMSHDWYTMRIYDSNGACVAEQKLGAHTDFCAAVIDLDGDAIDEILLYFYPSHVSILKRLAPRG